MPTMRSPQLMLSFSLLASGLLTAQDYRARVQGLVTDPTQAAVVGAKVTLKNINTGIEVARGSDVNGKFIFDYVEPGAYTLTAEAQGFGKFVKENIQVLVRSDVTVDISLQVGDVTQTVTVSETAVQLQFNTTTLSRTIDSKMLQELPVLARNPYTLALLDPAVVNRYWDISHRNPFYQLSSTGVDVGGQTSGRNEVLIDGVPIGVGSRGSYSPPMDAVQEFTVQQNSIEAEFGHSAGGVLNVGMKAGTNQYHGSLYYFGRNPKFNAVSNAVTRSPNPVRNHVGGGTIGAPIFKNRLFTFFVYEQWKNRQPSSTFKTLPTDLERVGDFSRTVTKAGVLRPIYDPMTTKFNAVTGVVVRTPFASNVVPPSRINPTSRLFMNDIWKPNSPGDDATGVNNFKLTYPWFLDYWNFSDRTDWNITPQWKMFARYSLIRTRLDNPNYANSPAVTSDNGGLMDALNAAFDTVYTLSARTVLNFRMGVVYSEDDYDSQWAKLKESDLARYWPNNPWYKPYLAELPAIYYPNISVTSAGFGKSSYWLYRPRTYTYQGSVAHDRGRHYMKWGASLRHAYEYSQLPNLGAFPFAAGLTADTFISPNTLLRGNQWATFLLGALESSTVVNYVPQKQPFSNHFGVFFQDDFKISRRVTLNLGLRHEYEGAVVERKDRMARYIDLSDPIPEFQSNPPKLPPEAAALRGAAPKYVGAFHYADSSHRGLYNAPKTNFLPRLGIALRANDRTAVRIGYARYAFPIMSVLGYAWRIPATDGFTASTSASPVLEGIPSAFLNDPFPASNPLIMPRGRADGRYTNLGGSPQWVRQDLKTPMNDRFNFTVERELPDGMKVDATFFMNFGHNMVPEGQGGNAGTGQSLNMMDPQISYAQKAVLSQRVPNPFYQILTPDKFPGQLRNQATVTVGSLLVPYPQYTGLTESFMPGVENRYKALQLRLQRRFAKGYSFLVGYNYNRESTGAWFSSDDQFINKLTMQAASSPRHRLSLAGTYDLPFGKGRALLSNLHPVLNAVLGGWTTSSIFLWNSGGFLRFGSMLASGDPTIPNPTRDRWFDTSKFQQLPAYTPRTNPWQYPSLTGPGYWNLDTNLSKNFSLTERFRLEFRLEAYNLTNSFMLSDPNLGVLNSLFGRSTGQANYGREIQYTARLHF